MSVPANNDDRVDIQRVYQSRVETIVNADQQQFLRQQLLNPASHFLFLALLSSLLLFANLHRGD